MMLAVGSWTVFWIGVGMAAISILFAVFFMLMSDRGLKK